MFYNLKEKVLNILCSQLPNLDRSEQEKLVEKISSIVIYRVTQKAEKLDASPDISNINSLLREEVEKIKNELSSFV